MFLADVDLNNLFAVSSAINGLTAFAIGLAILFSAPRKFLNRIFFLLSIATTVWSAGYYFWLMAPSPERALFWIGVLNLGSTFIPVLYYHWICALFGLQRRRVLVVIYLVSIAFACFSFSHLYVDHLAALGGFRFWPQAGALYPFFIVVLYGGMFISGLVETVRVFYGRVRDGATDALVAQRREVARYVFAALFFSGIAGATNFWLWFGVAVPPYGNLFVVLQILLFAYAIFKFNMMEAQEAVISFAIVLVTIAIVLEVLRSDNIPGILYRSVILILFLYFARMTITIFERERAERRRSEELVAKLAAANKRLRTLDRAKSDMLSIAAHQLRTPLTAMNGYLSLVLEGVPGEALGAKTNEMLSKVSRATARLGALVNNLLNMSRIDDGRMQYNFQPVQIEKLIYETAETFDVLAQERGLRLILDITPETLPPVLIDEVKMHEVISNLINNALKYTKEGAITIRVWLHDARHVRFSVQDTGVGIPDDVKQKLFSKFTRADKEQLNTEGAGIGLYVCYNIVRDHGGRIWVESEGEGKGAEFIVELKAAPKKDAHRSSR